MIDDVQAITNLVYAYPELLDTGELDGLGILFEHAVIRIQSFGQEFQGATGARALIEQTVQLYEGIPHTKHVVTNVIVGINDSRRAATARSYYTAFQARPRLPLQPILAGRWHDRFDRIDGRWRYVERLIYLDLLGDVSCHLKGLA